MKQNSEVDIPVTKTFFPDIEEYTSYLKKVWEKGWLTNRGELVQELEAKLTNLLAVDNMLIVNNGTIAIQIAIKSLEIKGEVITTPFSYVATASSLVWENCQPVFVDIDPYHLTINETKIEDAITPSTTAILATHVYGNMCHVEVIEAIAKKYRLKVIYDAAHSFGVRYKGVSAFLYGDISTTSFHATKIFHTGEGGAIFTSDKALSERVFYMHNFGHNGPEAFHGLGINGKISELHAAMGLAVFPYINQIIESRKQASVYYDSHLKHLPILRPGLREGVDYNYAYYPVIFESEEILLKIRDKMNEQQIFPRRYFYPSLTELPYVNRQTCEVANDVSKRIMCLPLFYGISNMDQNLIVNIISNSLSGS